MSIADWIILGFLVFSVTAAALEGFFRRPSSWRPGRGILVGRLAVSSSGGLVRASFEIAVAGRDRRVPDYFFRVLIVAVCRTDRALGNEKAGLSSIDRVLAHFWFAEERIGGGDCTHRHDRVCSRRQVAGGIGVGTVFPGRRKGCYLAGTVGITPPFLPGLDYMRQAHPPTDAAKSPSPGQRIDS